MSTTGRIALLVVAAVIAVGAFVALRPAGDAAPPSASTQPGTATVVTAEEAAEVATTPETTPEPAPEPPKLVAYRGGKAVGGVQKLDFDSGETVTLRLRSDVAEEIHIHGYDKYVQLEAGRTRTVTFEGTLEGVFEIEAHSTGTPLAELRVSPS